jgi:hypothetical protein
MPSRLVGLTVEGVEEERKKTAGPERMFLAPSRLSTPQLASTVMTLVQPRTSINGNPHEIHFFKDNQERFDGALENGRIRHIETMAPRVADLRCWFYRRKTILHDFRGPAVSIPGFKDFYTDRISTDSVQVRSIALL